MTDINRVASMAELATIAKRLPEGDFRRLLSFAQSLQEQRSGKRQQRYQAMSDRKPPIQEGWRIGN